MKNLISLLAFAMISLSVAASHPVIPVKSDTMLIKAVRAGNIKDVKRLLKSNNRLVNQLGIDHKTAMDVAVEFGNSKIAILLSKHGGKVTRSDNSEAFKSMLKYRAKRYIISFVAMFLFAPLLIWALDITFNLAECVSAAYYALAIPVLAGTVVYAGFEWSRLFKGFSMYSQAECSWMIQIPDIA
jgi:ankyrin repeat protein